MRNVVGGVTIINGVRIEGAHSVHVKNGQIIVDGKPFEAGEITNGILEIRVEGVLGELVTDRSVTCTEVQGDVDAGGSVSCTNVGGSVDAGGSVNCGDITGNVDAGGSINAKAIMGKAKAGGSIRT
jgi:hypothetical protein